MVRTFFNRFATAFGTHLTNRLVGKTTWDSAQLIIADSLVRELNDKCAPFEAVIPNRNYRKLIFDGLMSGDLASLKAGMAYCKIMSPRPECCDVYKEAFASLTQCHPPQIKIALAEIIKRSELSDLYKFGSSDME